MAKASDNVFPKVILGPLGAPTAPSDASWKLYPMADGLYARSSNTIVGPLGGGGGSVATDSIWTTAGKVAVATGTATATEQYPPGFEFNYTEKTSDTSITATTEGTADTVVTAGAVTFDGSTAVSIEFFTRQVSVQATAGAAVTLVLYDGSSSIGFMGSLTNPASAAFGVPAYVARRITPSAASHTYSIRALTSSGTSTIRGGAGGNGAHPPAFIRITKA